jgi:photosystem II stability/assembly factor-like uncharacterized protein
VNVTGGLRNLSDDDYADIQAQAEPRKLVFEWLGAIEYSTNGLAALAAQPYNNIVNVKDFGAIGYDGVADDYPAFRAALDYLNSRYTYQVALDYQGFVAGTLYVPNGLYRLSQTLVIEHQTNLVGEGGGGIYDNGCVLMFRTAENNTEDVFDGIYIKSELDETNSFYIANAEGSSVQGFRMLGGGGTHGLTTPPTPSWNEDSPLNTGVAHTGFDPIGGCAFRIETRAYIFNCAIDSWLIDGIHFNSDDGVKNPAGSKVSHCAIINCGRHGIYMMGSNANIMTIENTTNNQMAGWSVYDRSELGNYYAGVHTEECGHHVTDIRALVVDPGTANALMLGSTDGGVMRSLDQGVTTESVNLGLTGENVSNNFFSGRNWPVLGFALDSSYLYAACGKEFSGVDAQGVYRIASGSKETWPSIIPWTQQNSGLTNLDARALLVFTDGFDYVFCATYGGGVFVSTNSAGTWTATNTGLSNFNVLSLAWDSSTTTLYAGTDGGGVFKSTDHGANWSATTAFTGTQIVRSLAVRSGDLYAGTNDGHIFKSSNAGSTWSSVLSQSQPVYGLSFAKAGTTNVYAAAGLNGFYVSTNSGSSFTQSNSGLVDPNDSITVPECRCVAVDPTGTSTSNVYVGCKASSTSGYNRGGIFISDDAGSTWVQASAYGERVFYGGGYCNASITGASFFSGCYSEADVRNSVANPSIMVGGVQAGWTARQLNDGRQFVITANGIEGLTLKAGHDRRLALYTAPSGGGSTGFANGDVLFVDATAGGVSVVLPAPSARPGQIIALTRLDGTLNFVVAVGTVNGASNLPILYPNSTHWFVSDADNNTWRTLDVSVPQARKVTRSTAPYAGGDTSATGVGALIYDTDFNQFKTTTASAVSHGISNSLWHTLPQIQASCGPGSTGAPYDYTTGEVLVTGTGETYIVSYTPNAQWNFMIVVYYRVITATTNVVITAEWEDGSGSQSFEMENANSPVGSYPLAPLYVNATTSPVAVKITAGTGNQVYISASIVAL